MSYGHIYTIKNTIFDWSRTAQPQQPQCSSAVRSQVSGFHFGSRKKRSVLLSERNASVSLLFYTLLHRACEPLHHFCARWSPLPHRWPQSCLRMWRNLRPRLDLQGLTRLLVFTTSRPVFQSSWPATTYSDPKKKKTGCFKNTGNWCKKHVRDCTVMARLKFPP